MNPATARHRPDPGVNPAMAHRRRTVRGACFGTSVSADASRPQQERGFTLIELLIVLSILALVAALGASVVGPSFSRNSLNAAADEIKSAVRFAQMSAASTGMASRIIFDDANDRMTVEQLAPDASIWNPAVSIMGRSLIDPPANALSLRPFSPGVAYQINFKSDPRYGGATLSAPTFGSGAILTFDADGTPSSSGSVTLTRGSRQLVVTVDGYSGEVTAQ